ncbi:unnamed protein product [Taenia asiatica]|uniref:Tudor domain-containing protein n=1 Tax=Taenia asiatica TaxID=60517 RepID=A0A0R3WB14_TAEAS|nr:unnamed protein product [Taenia asiatica]
MSLNVPLTPVKPNPYVDHRDACRRLSWEKGGYEAIKALVKKSNGRLRLCIDYRKVNAVTKMDVFSLPHINDSLYSLHDQIGFPL